MRPTLVGLSPVGLRSLCLHPLVLCLLLSACAKEAEIIEADQGGAGTSGAAPGSGGATASGGSATAGVAGAVGNGGAPGSGGAIAQGGSPGSGGTQGLGGSVGNGGTVGNGGATGDGGTFGNGGSPGEGGTPAQGGDMSQGGTPPVGGGDPGLGGAADAGGSPGAGGDGLGGDPGAGGALGGSAGSGLGGSNVGGSNPDALAPACWTGQNHGLVPTGLTTADALAWYEQWKSRQIADCGGGELRVHTGNNGSSSNETFSEGTGYGLILAVAFDDRTTFDGLLAYYKSHLNPNNLMGWKGTCGENYESGCAADGDLDAAMAMIQALSRWGEDYRAIAEQTVSAIRDHLTMESDGMVLLLPGDSENFGGPNCLNPSYFSPAYYRSFAALMPADAELWNRLVTDSYTLLALYQAAKGGLVPDWGTQTSATGACRQDTFGYDAIRTPWRIANDLSWCGNTEAQTFLDSFNVNPIQGDNNATFVGAFTTAQIGGTQATLDDYYTRLAAMDDNRYFEDTLHVLYLTVLAQVSRPVY